MARVLVKKAALESRTLDIVLYHLTHNEITPWVTWIMNIEDKSTGSGHYHNTREEAMEEFYLRCRQQGAIEYTDRRPLRA